MRIFLCGGLLALLTGCAASVHPLCDPATAEPDKRLVGMWEQHDPESAHQISYVHIAREPTEPLDKSRREPEPGLMRYSSLGHNEQTLVGDEFNSARFVCTRIGDTDYASILFADAWGFDPIELKETIFRDSRFGFLLFKYEVTDDALVVWMGSENEVAESIVSRQIAGIAKRNKQEPGKENFSEWETVCLTASTADLRAFIATGGAEKWFSDNSKIVLRRLR
jgi:hypothetical protein